MSDPQRVAVVGATGYAGFELAQLLLRHPGIAKPTFYLRESAKPVNCLTEIFPQLTCAILFKVIAREKPLKSGSVA